MYLTKGDIPVLTFLLSIRNLKKKHTKTVKGTKLRKIDNDKEWSNQSLLPQIVINLDYLS